MEAGMAPFVTDSLFPLEASASDTVNFIVIVVSLVVVVVDVVVATSEIETHDVRYVIFYQR